MDIQKLAQHQGITVKPVFFAFPYILRISRAWQVRENNGPRKFEYSGVSV